MRTKREGRGEAGTTLVELAVFTAVIVPLMVALATTVSVFSSSTTAGHHRANVNSQNHRILQKIAAELSQACTDLDHPLSGNAATPESESTPATQTNTAYDYVTSEPLHAIGMLHDNLERDGTEHWHPEIAQRRLYIYGTFAPFDTIEYQRVKTPTSMSHISATTGSVVQPWSTQRKIFLMDGRVYLRARTGPGTFQTVVLGTNVEALAFHLNQDGHVIIRLTTGSRSPSGQGSTLTTQITVHPRNGLS